jgi:hypothetical protein
VGRCNLLVKGESRSSAAVAKKKLQIEKNTLEKNIPLGS